MIFYSLFLLSSYFFSTIFEKNCENDVLIDCQLIEYQTQDPDVARLTNLFFHYLQ